MRSKKRGFKHFYLKGLLDVDPISGCWIFLGRQSNGYGKINFKGWNDRWTTTTAQRYFFGLYRSGLRDILDVAHKCHRRCCVNPRHLRLATRLDNTQDWWIDQKFTPDQIEQVCIMMAADLPVRVIADRMMAPRPYISRLISRVNWQQYLTDFDFSEEA